MVKGEEGTTMPLCLKGMHVFCDMGWGWDCNILNLAIHQFLRLRETHRCLCSLILSRGPLG